MSVAKVIEILAEGSTIEEAAQSAVAEAGKTIRNIRTVYITDFQGIVEGGRITRFRVNAKITFVVGE
jgi:dodecin